MKKVFYSIILILALSCSSEEIDVTTANIHGKWVTYEIKKTDGSILKGPFTFGIFGSYSDSILLNADNNYVPVMTIDTPYLNSEAEAGNFVYTANKLELTGGAWEMTFNVEKLTSTHLWLKTSDITYKLKRVD